MLIIDEENAFDYERMESRGRPQTKDTPACSGELFYSGHPLKVDPNQPSNIFTQKRQELFCCGLGEKGSNELQIYSLNSDTRRTKCLKTI